MEKISDVQYVKNYDENIGALYEEAKSSYIDAPIQTLVSLRSIVHEICKQIHDEFSLDSLGDVFYLINKLKSKKIVNTDVIDLMHSIRTEGKYAAHKHQYDFTMKYYRESSEKSIRDFCLLIEALNSALRNNISTYFFESKVESFLEKLSYKVIFDNDPKAKFKVGMALIEQVITRWNEKKLSGLSMFSDNGKISHGVEFIREAADHRYPDAMFEYGVMLSRGQYVEKDIEKAMSYLWSAANWEDSNGVADISVEAKAYFGYTAIEEHLTEYLQDGINLLKESAEELNPFALTILSQLYAQGVHVELDLEKSNQLLAQAVSQEYPPALYTFALVKMQEEELELSIQLLKKSKDLGHYPASLMLARVYASSTKDYHQQAKSEYIYYLESCDQSGLDYLEIKFEFAKFRFLIGGNDLKSLKEYGCSSFESTIFQ